MKTPIIFNPSTSPVFFREQANKFGAWSSNECQVTTWYLEPKQEIIPSVHETSVQVFVVMSGGGIFTYAEAKGENNMEVGGLYEPSPVQVVKPPPKAQVNMISKSYEAGDVIIVPTGLLRSFRSADDTRSTLLNVTTPRPLHTKYLSR